MKEVLIQLCDINRFGYWIRKASNNTLSSAQINEVCFFERDRSVQNYFIETCKVVIGKAYILAEGSYRCAIDTVSTISSFAKKPCNPIRWDPNALVQKFCSSVGNNTGSFSSTTPAENTYYSQTERDDIPEISFNPTTESLTTTTLADKTLGLGVGTILIIAGGSAIIIGAIGGIVWYTCSKSSKSTATNFQEEESKLSTRSKEEIESASNLLQPKFSMSKDFEEVELRLSTSNSQKDKESTSLLLQPTLEKSNTPTEGHYDIPKSDMPVFTMPTEGHYDIPKSNMPVFTMPTEGHYDIPKSNMPVFTMPTEGHYDIPKSNMSVCNNKCHEAIEKYTEKYEDQNNPPLYIDKKTFTCPDAVYASNDSSDSDYTELIGGVS